MVKLHSEVMKRHAWALPFEIIMAIGMIILVWTGQYGSAGICLFLLAASAVLPVLEHVWRIRLSPLLHFCYVGFLFASLFAGEVLNMYSIVQAWDDGLHFVSGLLVGLAGTVWLTTLVQRKVLRAPVWLQVVMIVALGALVAVVWELVEFTSDHWFGTFMQRNDLFDTMTDFAYGMLGTLIIAGLFSRYLHHHRSWGIAQVLAQQQQLND